MAVPENTIFQKGLTRKSAYYNISHYQFLEELVEHFKSVILTEIALLKEVKL